MCLGTSRERQSPGGIHMERKNSYTVCKDRGSTLLLVFHLCQSILELLIYRVKVFWHHLDIREHGHKVRIAIPARHDMIVDMLSETRTRHFALVNTHVEAIGMHGQA